MLNLIYYVDTTPSTYYDWTGNPDTYPAYTLSECQLDFCCECDALGFLSINVEYDIPEEGSSQRSCYEKCVGNINENFIYSCHFGENPI